MSRPVTFGIVGGYGATGRIVASELRRSGDGEILIGGRDLAQAQALAAEFDSRASAAQLDILDVHSLDDFCRRCSIIVNCAGPVILLQDRVAQAALRQRCHYIDAAGMSLVKERMLPRIREIENLGLSFVISAGWMPGISESLPAYAHSQACTRMDSIESLTVYFRRLRRMVHQRLARRRLVHPQSRSAQRWLLSQRGVDPRQNIAGLPPS